MGGIEVGKGKVAFSSSTLSPFHLFDQLTTFVALVDAEILLHSDFVSVLTKDIKTVYFLQTYKNCIN